MRGRLGIGLVGLIACLGSLGGCMSESGPRLSAQDPGLRAAILAAGGAQPGDRQVRGQIEEQEGSRPREGLGDSPLDSAAMAARIAVVVNGQAILENEVRAITLPQMSSLNGVPEPERSEKLKEIRTKALDSLIERELVMQEAFGRLGARGAKVIDRLKDYADKEFRKNWMRPIMEANNLKTEEQLEDILEKSGTSLQAVKYGWERNLMSQEYLRNKVFPILDRVSIQDILAYYRKHPEEFTVADSVVWQDIFIDVTRHPSREEARRFSESLAQRARNGEDFVKLCETFDNGDASLRKNAEGIGNKPGEIRPGEVQDVLFRLREKDVGPVVETPTGYHIVRVLERTYAGKKPFDEKVQKQIRDKLRSELAGKEMKRIINELKAQAILEYPRP
jgi:parvulin-like peptidyl-prolyl isomerase